MKALVRTSASLFLIRALPAAAFLLSSVFISRSLRPADYGIYQGYWSLILLCSSLACIGLPTLLITIPAEEAVVFFQENKEVRFALCLAVSLAAIAFLFGNKVVVSPVSGLVILGCTTCYAIAEAILLRHIKTRLLVRIAIGYALLFLVAHVLFLKGIIDFKSLFAAIAFISLLKLGAALALIPHGSVRVERDSKTRFALWGHLAFYDATQYLFKWVDKIILSLLLAPAAFAVYFNGTYDVPFIPLLLGAAGNTLLMHLSGKAENVRQQASLQRKAALLMSNIVFPVFFFLAFFRNEIFTVIFTAKYALSASLFLVAILVLPLRTHNFTTLLQHAGKGRIINTGAVLDLIIALALMWPLYTIWGLRGVAFSFVISTYFQASFYLYKTAQLLEVSVFELMPVLQLFIRFIVFGIGYMAIYYSLHAYLSPAAMLFLGAGLTCIAAGIPMLRARLRP